MNISAASLARLKPVSMRFVGVDAPYPLKFVEAGVGRCLAESEIDGAWAAMVANDAWVTVRSWAGCIFETVKRATFRQLREMPQR